MKSYKDGVTYISFWHTARPRVLSVLEQLNTIRICLFLVHLCSEDVAPHGPSSKPGIVSIVTAS